MLSGNLSLCSVFELVSPLQFPSPWHLRFCQPSCFLTEAWGEAACQKWEELTVTCMHIILHTFSNFLCACTHKNSHTHTPHWYTMARTAWGGVDGLDIWSWLTRRENEGKAAERRKEAKRQERFSKAACRKELEGKAPSCTKKRRCKEEEKDTSW